MLQNSEEEKLSQLLEISQSHWLIEILDIAAASFWETNESDCDKMRLLFLCVTILVRSKINTFFDVEYCGKKQIECGLALSVLLSTTTVNHIRFV